MATHRHVDVENNAQSIIAGAYSVLCCVGFVHTCNAN